MGPSLTGRNTKLRLKLKLVPKPTRITERQVSMVEKCAECGKVTPKNQVCEYCKKTFCEDHYTQHMAWEKRHENLAEDSSRLWKRKREQ